MPDVRYEAPRSIDQAVSLLHADPGAAILAGGTDLIIQCRTGAKRPTAFIDVKHIPRLVAITLDDRWLHIGAAACAADITGHPDVRRLWPGIVDAVQLIGSAQIQGRGTVGGNLCNASPAADATCALIVNEAVCVIAGPRGDRLVAVEEFCIAPGRTVLERGEILVELRVARPPARTADAYLRLIPRTEMDIAVASAGVSVTLDAAGVCTAARVAVGAVAPTGRLVPEAAAAVIGSSMDAAALARAAAAASAAARPIDDKRGTVSYRRRVVGVLTSRALEIAVARAKER
jgi:CO/xanthine dehydrogenase FAD-binding subunit